MIIYQLHVGTFAGRNDPFGSTWNPSRYWDVMDRVSHLQELGVTAVHDGDCVIFDDLAIRFGSDDRVRSVFRTIDGSAHED